MSMNLGINLVETNGLAVPSIQGAATSVAGFVVRSRRGVPGVVRQVTSYNQFVEYFGDVMDGAFGAFAVRGFFENGGSIAYVYRGVHLPPPPPATPPANPPAPDTTVATVASRSFPAGTGTLTVEAGFRGRADPGAWGRGLSIQIEANSDNTLFNLLVWEPNKTAPSERWDGLKAVTSDRKQDPIQRINDELSGSNLIKITLTNATANPAATSSPERQPLDTGGTDDTPNSTTLAALLERPFDNGVFDPYEVQLIACPETTAITSAALDYCESRGDCMFVGHASADENGTAAAAKTFGQGQEIRRPKACGALYFPFIRVSDPRGGTKWVPPTGHVMGVYARTERERGIWKAPAGNAARVRGALDVAVPLSDVQHTDLVKNGSVNAIRFISGQGIVIDSSRTLSTDTLWLYVNVRLLFNYVKSSLKYGLRWTVQEPNDKTLWNKVKYNSVTPFLMNLWRRGAFGPGSPDQVFSIKVDEENNPPVNIQQGLFNVEVYFYPSRPAETIVITVGQQEGGAKVGER